MSKLKIIVSVLTGIMLTACGSKKDEKPNIYHGNITVGTDESINQVIQAQMDAYKMRYSGAHFQNKIIPESQAIKLFLLDSLDVICITRVLTEEELKPLTERNIKYKPAPMALDAVVLVTNHSFAGEEVSMEQLKDIFAGKSSDFKLVFDRGNSSNLNLVMNKLGIKEIDRTNVVSANGNENVFEWVKKDRNAIGFVGFNYISEKSSPVSRALRESVKVLGVKTDSTVLPVRKTILEQSYPFNRVIYLHTITGTWGVENGFIRFACSKPGQLVVEKMGLVPFYKIPKEFFITNEPME